LCCAELEKSNQVALSLEENMRRAEQERLELEDARVRAEEARRVAEEAANLEKEERDRKVALIRYFSLYCCSNAPTIITTTVAILQLLCVCWHCTQLRTGVFCWSKVLLPACY